MAQDMSINVGSNDCLPDDVWPVGRKAAFYSCFVVLLLGVFDFVDRQVLAAVLPYIKAEWTLSDTQLGLLIAVVNVSISVLVVPSAYLVDRWSRKRMIAVMGTVWSLATAACAFAGSYSHLLAARVFIGAGEAGYNPAAQALLTAQFPKRHRSLAVALTQFGMTMGVPVGLFLGGFIASHWGWRHAMGIVAIPGIVLSVMALFIRDYKSVEVKNEDGGEKMSYPRQLARLMSTPSILCVFVGCIMMMIHYGALINWQPSYFNRVGGMSVATASSIAALIMVANMISTLAVGPVIDAVCRRRSNGAPLVMACSLSIYAILAMCGYGLMTPGSTAQIALLFISGIFGSVYTTGGSTIIIQLAHPGARATAISLMVFFQNILGFALGPVLVGILSDHFSLGAAMTILSLAPAVAALIYLVCIATFRRDAARVACINLEFEGK